MLKSRHPAPRRAITSLIVAAALAACANTKDSAATPGAKQGAATGEVSQEGLKGAAGSPATPAVSSVKYATGMGPTPEQERQAIAKVGTTLPKRPRPDSVALASMTKGDTALDKLWPVKIAPPLPGALLPANRILAFYGNPLSKKMGVLGEYPKDEMLKMLDREVANWTKADPSHPVVPALHFIVTVAQGAPGKNGLYRLQMRDSMTNEIYGWAKAHHALLFLDVQAGMSTIEAEIPRLKPFLENPDVHLAIDPEFAMQPSGAKPSTRVGTVDAKDVNWAINFLDQIVKEKHLPPKVLIVHRWTRKMVTNAKDIKPVPNVQVVMDMDGWGPPWLKFDSYHDYIKREPVQFTGFKLFYHNDTKKGNSLLTPAEVLRLNPKPLYIQYQ